MRGTVVMTGPTMTSAFLAGVHNTQAQPLPSQASARSIAAVTAVNPSARERKGEAPERRLESLAESSKSWSRGTQARDPRGRQAFEAELQARVDPVLRRLARKRRGQRRWREEIEDPPVE